MKNKLPIIIIIVGCIISFFVGTTHPIVEKVGAMTQTSTNYTLICIGFAISLLAGIITLWLMKKKQ